MGELMTKYMWYERHQEVIAESRRRVSQFTQKYKKAYIYCIFKNMRLNLTSSTELPSLLMEQRKWENYNRPLITGAIHILRTHGPKKWQKLHCVLQPTYLLEVYGSEKDFETAQKPLFSIHHEIYDVIENVDAHLSDVIKVYLREFGFIMENVSHVSQRIGSLTDANKRPSQHVLSLYHKYQGSIYLAFDSALEKDRWLECLRDAHRHLAGIHCENPVKTRAFEIAIKQACDAEDHCNFEIRKTGTQQQILWYFITSYLSNGCKAMLKTKVKGDVIKKFKMWAQISKGLSDTVEGVVNQDYPELCRKAEKEAEDLTQQIASSMTRCNSVYNSISESIREDMMEKLSDEVGGRILPHYPHIVETLEESVHSTTGEVKTVFSMLTAGMYEKILSESTVFANNIDTYFVKEMDRAPRNPQIMRSVFAAAVTLTSQRREFLSKFPALEYKEELCILAQTLLDSAVYTLEVLCGDAVLKSNGRLENVAMKKVEAHVLKKFDHDSKVLSKRFSSRVIISAIYQTVYPSIYQYLKNKMQNYQDLIPHDHEIAHILLIDQVFADTIEESLVEMLKDHEKASNANGHARSDIEKLADGDYEQTSTPQSLSSIPNAEPEISESMKDDLSSNNVDNAATAMTYCTQDMETGEATELAANGCQNDTDEAKVAE